MARLRVLPGLVYRNGDAGDRILNADLPMRRDDQSGKLVAR
jgi:hypothetical protein